jgi:hypothetical protein
MTTLRPHGPTIAGFVLVLFVGLALGPIVVPPVVDTIFPLSTPGLAGASPGVGPTPSPATGILMNGVPVGTNADCGACHTTVNGTMGVVPIPALAHPLAGFSSCTSCHTNARLVATAPGHQSFTQDECLACHKEQGQGTAPSRPHHVYPGQECTTCHNGKTAPLPKDMTGRTACWICHHETPGASLFPVPAVGPSPSASP